MDRTNSNLHWFESSWSSNDVFHSPAFLGTSQASLCSWKSPTLSFPDIVYNIILDPGSASRVIQHFLHPNLFILPRFYETALLNVKTADCAALSPFLCRDTVFQCRSLWLKCCRDSEAIMSPRIRRNCVVRRSLPHLSKLMCWARSIRGGVRGVQEELGVQLHCGFALV